MDDDFGFDTFLGLEEEADDLRLDVEREVFAVDSAATAVVSEEAAATADLLSASPRS